MRRKGVLKTGMLIVLMEYLTMASDKLIAAIGEFTEEEK